MWELDYKESWAPKNWCFWTVVLEKTFENPLDCEEVQPVNPKRNQSWIFTGQTDVEAETPILRPSDVKSWLIWKVPDDRKDCRWKEKGTTEYEMVGWHHWLDGHEFEQASGVGDGQGGLACYSLWGRKESDRTEWLNWIELLWRVPPVAPDGKESACNVGDPGLILYAPINLKILMCLSFSFNNWQHQMLAKMWRKELLRWLKWKTVRLLWKRFVSLL